MNLRKDNTPANNNIDSKSSSRATSLNPNAEEFVPLSLRTLACTPNPGNVNVVEPLAKDLNHLDSSLCNDSDEETHHYWRHRLPDDITPDFTVTENSELMKPENMSLGSLLLYGGKEMPKFSLSTGAAQDAIHPNTTEYAVASYSEDPGLMAYMNVPNSHWNESPLVGGNNFIGKGRGSDMGAVSVNQMSQENAFLTGSDINPVEFLASQFPGFSAESLAEIFYANSYDLNMTIEMLIQLEMQADDGYHDLHSKAHSAPNLTAMDFPSLPVESRSSTKIAAKDPQYGDREFAAIDKADLLFRLSNSNISSRNLDFASAVRKLSEDSGNLKYERNGAANTSRSALTTSKYNGNGSSFYGRADRSHGRGSNTAPTWLETGESVANIYTDLREEARDHARLRNACFEQARQAYLIGNKALAKELSIKGQAHSTQMKAAHGKAREHIYRHRNPVPIELQGHDRGHEPIIDLHGLHVSEAIHMLKHELNILRSIARSAGKCLQVSICVGTGHHTKGSRTPARLPVAIEKYLVEEECLDCTETQPGLFRVVIY